MKLFSILTAVIFSFSIYGAEKLYQYQASYYPIKGTDCQVDAAELGSSLAEFTGVSIYQTYCKKEKYSDNYQLVVTYQSQKPLRLVSTYDKSNFPAQAGYVSLEDCESAIEAEEKLFESETGISTFLSYCYAENSKAVVLRIDGFGTPKLRPYTSSAMIRPGLIAGNKIAIEKEIAQNLLKNGIRVSTVLFLDEFPYYDLVIRYYGEYKIFLRAQILSDYPNTIECTRQREDASGIFSEAPTPPLGLACTSGNQEPWNPALHAIIMNTMGLKKIRPPDRYQTLDDCVQDKQKVIKYYSENVTKTVVGAFCGYRDTLYYPILFEE